MSYTYDYPRPALTVDAVIFGLDEDELKILLIQRAGEPFKGSWAFPGGFVEMDETTEEAVQRELEEETGIKDVFLEQLYTFSGVQRDPRERVVSVAYFGLVKPSGLRMAAASDAQDVRWFAIDQIPDLAFDHREILQVALKRLRGKIRYEPIGFELLPPEFTMSQLLRLYSNALGKPVDKRNFIRKIKKFGILNELPKKRRDGAHRPATLYSFNGEKYRQLKQAGIDFEL
ncbi:NUDIX domain-containing protein [Pelagicoccus sp. SDUM812003]|uniref:NUDIX hydrolase n=1 Tax=Pelagicoccus sp. SDUM812003 TaxID=3041267 RepID=UPI00280E1ED7|nr:NUDIX domain-containing protein [Pelagicoccus sp. SDUM812003]MDQ8202344.1 NUDIX domain-containing protein [Pelagicoccus sp. SDUM812003]